MPLKSTPHDRSTAQRLRLITSRITLRSSPVYLRLQYSFSFSFLHSRPARKTMDEQQQPSSLATAFPHPPPFWRSFSPENLSQICALRAAQAGSSSKDHDASKSLPPRLLDLPPELRNLQPPEPPADGHYRCFGDPFWVCCDLSGSANLKRRRARRDGRVLTKTPQLDAPLPTLQDLSISQLYTPPSTPTGHEPHASRAFTLKKLAKSLLLNFLELVGVMAINPELYAEKVEDIKTLFVNFHHLLNEYRPHQARESVILMMQDQLERSRKETRGMREVTERVERVLEGLAVLKGGLGDAEDGAKAEESVDEERSVWEELERQFAVPP
ncbi:hypothetical protein B2J93_2106 [Marssonina coronariae]|uniref:Mediator of RNA polymerase II transcription subunit 7 n=1 Tax=Diplocarpon coronariae TaxID=2795749 RepID=A0A218Z1R5_9HELO|nr:hypothetical protein JHW43_005167 [Diplocarpon mali]OWP01590.1 hypothetical protein B2J93_2106 [Marssonina coronariae]